MNKLRTRIKEATSPGQASLGFGAVSRKKQPTLLLVARGSGEDVAAVASAVDAYITTSDRPRGVNEIPAGRMADGKGKNEGFDFLVVDEKAPATVLLDEDAAYLMQAEADIPDSLLRAFEALNLDGLLVDVGESLSVRDQVELVRLAGFTRKPLFAALKDAPSAESLEVLRDAGVVALVLDAASGPARFAALRESIAALPPRRQRRREDRDAVTVSAPTPSSGGEDDEHDHDFE